MFMQSMGGGVSDAEFSPDSSGISAAGTLSSGRLSPAPFYFLTDPFYKIVFVSLYPAGKMSTT